MEKKEEEGTMVKIRPGKRRRRAGGGVAGARRCVDKIVGADYELGNFVLGADVRDGTGPHASRALLAKIEGVSAPPRHTGWGVGVGGWGWGQGGYRLVESPAGIAHLEASGPAYGAVDPQDSGRKYTRNGGCAYLDLAHLEVCVPEVRSAWDHVAACRAMLEIASRAQASVNADLPDEYRVEVLANNSDGQGQSYGTHLNVCVTRELWDDLFRQKLQKMLLLASFQVSSIVFTGQGKVGAENRRPWTPFQLSQRADFMETLTGVQTTWNRPIVNSRDETLCGDRGRDGDDLARLHVIFYDHNLCPVAALLKIGTLQIVTAMLEAGWCDLSLILDDPVEAVLRYSHGANLRRRCRLANGEKVTAVALQQRFVAAAREALERGWLETVPRAAELIALWDETLALLEAGDLDALAGRLDWVLKRRAIEQTLEQRADLEWDSAELLYLDQIYGSLDRERGIFFAYEASGLVESVVTPDEIARFVDEPPDDTRAWTRAHLLRRLDPASIELLDWHELRVRTHAAGQASASRRIALGDPGGSTRADNASLFAAVDDTAELIEQLADPAEADAPQPTRGTLRVVSPTLLQ